MKKPYSLDYSIERDTDRTAAIYDILDRLEKVPSNTELEQMANYILYGKDENNQNTVQRKEITDSNKRYSTFKTMDDKLLSLDELLENPMADQQTLEQRHKPSVYKKPKPCINKPKYDKKTGELIDPGDSDIPYMKELWESIDRMEHTIAVNEGKLPADDTTPIIKDDYRLYQLKHWLVDLRRHQYYLKDVFKPELHFPGLDHPKQQFIDWTSDSYYWCSLDQWKAKVENSYLSSVSKDLKDYETRVNSWTGETEVKWIVQRHTFDWENPLHVKALMNWYDPLYDQLYEKLDTYGRTLIWDFERYRKMAHLSEVRDFILEQKINRVPYGEIVENLQIKYGLKYTENYLCTILSKEIPEKIAQTAQKWRLICETPEEELKQCYTCGRKLPRHKLFFVCNKNRKDGFSSNCKECEKLRRIERGGQSVNDQRNKETQVLKMQTGQT